MAPPTSTWEEHSFPSLAPPWSEIRFYQKLMSSWEPTLATGMTKSSTFKRKPRRFVLLIHQSKLTSHFNFLNITFFQILKLLKQMAFLSSLKQIAGRESVSLSDSFMTEFFKLVLGTISLPINLPGTNYHRGFQVWSLIFSHLSLHDLWHFICLT